MARKIKTEQEKKKTRKKVIIIICSVLVVLAAAALLIWAIFFRKDDDRTAINVNILDQNDIYGYSLSDLDSEYFKSEYYKLKEILEKNPVDEEAYATQVARMFVIDLYSMSTKINKYDVGGVEYYHATQKTMYENKVIDTLYDSMLDDTYGDREQTLPEITNVETVSVEEIEYNLVTKEDIDAKKGDNIVKGYLVKLKFSYKEDLGYDKEASVIVCKEEGIRWSVVEFEPTLDYEY